MVTSDLMMDISRAQAEAMKEDKVKSERMVGKLADLEEIPSVSKPKKGECGYLSSAGSNARSWTKPIRLAILFTLAQ